MTLTSEQVAHAEREAWEAAHLGPDGDYLKLANGHVVKTSEYDADKHGPREPKPGSNRTLITAAACAELAALCASMIGLGIVIGATLR